MPPPSPEHSCLVRLEVMNCVVDRHCRLWVRIWYWPLKLLFKAEHGSDKQHVQLTCTICVLPPLQDLMSPACARNLSESLALLQLLH